MACMDSTHTLLSSENLGILNSTTYSALRAVEESRECERIPTELTWPAALSIIQHREHDNVYSYDNLCRTRSAESKGDLLRLAHNLRSFVFEICFEDTNVIRSIPNGTIGEELEAGNLIATAGMDAGTRYMGNILQSDVYYALIWVGLDRRKPWCAADVLEDDDFTRQFQLLNRMAKSPAHALEDNAMYYDRAAV